MPCHTFTCTQSSTASGELVCKPPVHKKKKPVVPHLFITLPLFLTPEMPTANTWPPLRLPLLPSAVMFWFERDSRSNITAATFLVWGTVVSDTAHAWLHRNRTREHRSKRTGGPALPVCVHTLNLDLNLDLGPYSENTLNNTTASMNYEVQHSFY